MTAPIIEMERLTKSYGGKRGIVDVSLEVGEGEVFGFLGPNGAGKTTTIRILMALLRADSGSARIAGLDCWEGSIDVKRLMKLVDRFDLDTSRKFRQYSTGNKRKVVLIQAFMHRPRVLILDEPTSGLDPLNQQEFDAIVKEARDEGHTVFLSSHVLSEVEKTCSRIGIIREGRLVRVGGIHELADIKRYEITITFTQPVPAEAFARLEGVTSAESLHNGAGVRLAVQGGADAVIKAAARYPVLSLTSVEPSLEDTFLRFYEADGHSSREAAGVV